MVAVKRQRISQLTMPTMIHLPLSFNDKTTTMERTTSDEGVPWIQGSRRAQIFEGSDSE